MKLTKKDRASIKDGSKAVPKEGTYQTDYSGSEIEFSPTEFASHIQLRINKMYFNAEDIKELRKFLKILEREIK